mgnify:CR=1 FL=1
MLTQEDKLTILHLENGILLSALIRIKQQLRQKHTDSAIRRTVFGALETLNELDEGDNT